MNVMLFIILAAPPPATPTPTPRPTAAPAIMVLSASQRSAPSGGGLADLARGIKLRLPAGGGHVITNERVRELSRGVELTTSIPGAPEQAEGNRLDQAKGEEEAKRQYWVGRYQDARREAESLQAEVARLEAETARLERDFYSRDDPAYRDGVIKPAWDQAIEDLRSNREKLEAARSEPDRVKDEALRDGAVPGWFRGLPEPSAPPAEATPGNTGG